jgi:hypothetical protein
VQTILRFCAYYVLASIGTSASEKMLLYIEAGQLPFRALCAKPGRSFPTVTRIGPLMESRTRTFNFNVHTMSEF